MDQLNADYERLSNKARFIQMVIDGKLIVNNRKKTALFQDLEKHEFKKMLKNANAKGGQQQPKPTDDADSDNEGTVKEEDDGKANYDYLLSMPIWSLTHEKVGCARFLGPALLI
jgi:DNA topoisomerase-2